jgi:hypothetical protein
MAKLIEDFAGERVMTADGFALDSVDDLDSLRTPTVGSLEITAAFGAAGTLRLQLGRKQAALEIHEPDFAARGLAAEIERIAATRQRFWARHGAWIAASVAVVLFAGGIVGLSTDMDALRWLLLPAMLLALLAGITFDTYGDGKSGAILYTKTKREAPRWLERNRDGLVTNVIVSAAFLAIGILIGYVLPRP